MQNLERIEQYRQILELSRLGMDAATITETMGFETVSATKSFLRKAAKSLASEAAEEVRSQELLRLEALEQKLWPHALAGSSQRDCIEFDRLLKVIQMRLEWSGARPAQLAPVQITDQRLQIVIQSFGPAQVDATQLSQGTQAVVSTHEEAEADGDSGQRDE